MCPLFRDITDVLSNTSLSSKYPTIVLRLSSFCITVSAEKITDALRTSSHFIVWLIAAIPGQLHRLRLSNVSSVQKKYECFVKKLGKSM